MQGNDWVRFSESQKGVFHKRPRPSCGFPYSHVLKTEMLMKLCHGRAEICRRLCFLRPKKRLRESWTQRKNVPGFATGGRRRTAKQCWGNKKKLPSDCWRFVQPRVKVMEHQPDGQGEGAGSTRPVDERIVATALFENVHEDCKCAF